MEAILRIQADMLLNEKCCTNFAAYSNMLKRFNSEIVYGEMSSAEKAEALSFLEYEVCIEEATWM